MQIEMRQHHISFSGVWARLELEDDSNLLLVFLYLTKKLKCPKIREELDKNTFLSAWKFVGILQYRRLEMF